MSGKQLWTISTATLREFGKDDISYLAAAVTYYAFFSVFPLILLAVSVASLFLDTRQANGFIFNDVAQFAPGSVKLLSGAVDDAVSNRANAGWLALVGLVALAFSASGAFDALDKAINRAWHTEKVPNLLVSKLTSFAMMAVIAALLLLAVVVSTTLTFTQQFT